MAKKSRRTTRTAAAGPEPSPSVSASTETPLARVHVWQVQMVRDVLFVAAVIGTVWAGYALRAVTVPLLVALLLAYLFEPLIERICARRKVRRPVAVGGLLAVVALFLVIVVALVLPLIVVQTTQLISDVREGRMRQRIAGFEAYVPASLTAEFRQFVETLPGPAGAVPPAARTSPAGEGVGEGVGEGAGEGAEPPPGPGPASAGAREGAPADASPDTPDAATPPPPTALTETEIKALIADELERRPGPSAAGPDAAGGWRDLAREVRDGLDAIFGVIGAVVQFGLLLFLIPFYFFFFSIWYPAVVKFGRDLLPTKNRKRAIELLLKMDRVIAGFVRGRIVISVVMGALLAIGWMVCGVPYALLLGFVVGIFCAVPYLGVIGIPLAVGFLFIDRIGAPDNGSLWWLWAFLWPTVVFGIVQLIEGYVLTPMIAGKATNLDPVTILVAVLAGGSVLGIYGMLLAIPLAACGKILFLEVLLPNIRAWVRGEVADPLPIDRD